MFSLRRPLECFPSLAGHGKCFGSTRLVPLLSLFKYQRIPSSTPWADDGFSWRNNSVDYRTVAPKTKLTAGHSREATFKRGQTMTRSFLSPSRRLGYCSSFRREKEEAGRLDAARLTPLSVSLSRCSSREAPRFLFHAMEKKKKELQARSTTNGVSLRDIFESRFGLRPKRCINGMQSFELGRSSNRRGET